MGCLPELGYPKVTFRVSRLTAALRLPKRGVGFDMKPGRYDGGPATGVWLG